ncbi:type VII secretion protein EssC, partial [Listeria welshimeri]|nr:type VII secretion protein EssC [Listeria welshimeri]
VMDLARQHNPEQLHVYLLDFGTNGLLPLIDLPHVADTMMVDEVEKVQKFIRRISEVMKYRKKLLSKYRVANIEQYEKASKDEIPNIIIVLDNYDAVREAGFGENFDKVIGQVSREGSSVGVFLATSASKYNSIKMQIVANIKMMVSLFIIDISDTRAIVGRTDLSIEELSGRGLVNQDGVSVMQTVLPTDGEDVLEQISSLKSEARSMKAAWEGYLPENIPMMPDELTFADFITKIDSKNINNDEVAIGLDFEIVEGVVWNFQKVDNILILGGSQAGKTTMQYTLLKGLERASTKKIGNHVVHIFDTNRGKLKEYREKEIVANYIVDKVAYEEFFNGLSELLEYRFNELIKIQDKEGEKAGAEFIQGEQKHFIFIQNIGDFGSGLSSELVNKLVYILDNNSKLGIHFIISGTSNNFGQNYSDFTNRVKQINSGIIIAGYNEQSIVKMDNINMYSPKLDSGDAYFVDNGRATRIKMPKH